MDVFKKTYQVLVIIGFLVSMMSAVSVSAAPNQVFTSQEDVDIAIAKGFKVITSQMNDDGGIRWFDESSSVATTLRVVHALAAAGYSQDYLISNSGKRPIDFLKAQGLAWVYQEEMETPAFSVARAGQLLSAIAAANENPRDFGGNSTDLIFELNTYYDPTTALYGQATPDSVLDQVWAIIGLSSNNVNVPVDAVDWLESAQKDDGSWDDGFGSFLDTTPLAMLALIGSNLTGIDSPSIETGIDFMMQNQQPNGGWQSEWDTNTNANITGVMLQVISILGQSASDDIWQKTDGNPTTALISIQQENGVFGVDFGNAYSTADAITGLSGKNIMSLGFVRATAKAFDFLISQQNTDGGWGSVGLTFDAMLALQAAGWQPNSVVAEEATPLDYISSNITDYIEVGPDSIGKSLLSLKALGLNLSQISESDLILKLLDTYNETDQAFGDPTNTWHQAFAILGLSATETEIPDGVVDTLINLQQDDGGWEYKTGSGSWPDNTALAVQALLAAGVSKDNEIIARAMDYFRTLQTSDGGWGDSSTTSYVLLALNALRQPFETWITVEGKHPISSLFSYQKPNGAFLFNWEFLDDNLMSTISALFAVYKGDYVIPGDETLSANTAAVVVDIGDGQIYADCVEFETSSISGLELLEISDFEFEMSEGFINSIMGRSNAEGETNYWSYWSWNGREWVFNNVGAGDSIVVAGTIQAWYFTSWEVFPSLPPRFLPDIKQICDAQILKNYTDQPHLNYNDLFATTVINIQQPIIVEEQVVATSTSEPIQTPLQEGYDQVEPTATQEKTMPESLQPNAAGIIIALAGVSVLLVVVLLILKKQS